MMKNVYAYEHIIWDWNGTLLDDISASLDSVNDMLIRRKSDIISINRYRECITTPIRGFYDMVFDMDKEDYESLLSEYNEGYMKHLVSCGLSDGAVELIEKWKNEGKTQAIISSSNSTQLTENVQKYGISHYFDSILGASDYLAVGKTERAKVYIKNNNIQPERLLVIGDLVHDAQLAEELGAGCVLLSTGHEKRERLNSCGVRVINSLRELL